MRLIMAATLAAFLAAPVTARAMGIEDDPVLLKVMAQELEWRAHDGESGLAWDVEAWLGRDLHKAWLKTEGEREDGETEKAEAQLLYSRAIASWWDVQAGWRRTFRPGSDQDWFAVSLQGLAPYWFHVDASLFYGGSGRTAARLEADHEFRLSRRWILLPTVEVNLHGEDDPERGIGSGLSSAEAGLRLRYEIRREFAPYVGVQWEGLFGDTADYAEAEGGETSGLSWVVGVRAWF